MFGFRFIKFQPNDYVLRYKNGRIVSEGAGMSFFYFAPTSSLVSIPVGSIDAPFIFEEVTADYQGITLQGQVSYSIADPKKIAAVLNFTLAPNGRSYVSEDPKNLPQRIVNVVQVLTKKEIQKLSLRDALRASDSIVAAIRSGIREREEIASMGIEILGLSILAIKPNKETARALEAEAREQILKEADDALYVRRNSSVEQERRIKENELNTEIAVENKKRQIREAQMDAEKSVQERRQGLERSGMAFNIQQEDERKKLIALSVENSKSEADAQAYSIAETMNAFKGVDPGILQALASSGMKPQQIIAMAFQGLAENAGKIGQLNITPDLLQEILKKDGG